MKKLILSSIVDPNTLFKPSKRTLVHIENSYRELCESLAKGMLGVQNVVPAGVYILFGLKNSTPGGGTYTISDGAILYSVGIGVDEIILVTGGTFTPGGGQTVVMTLATTYATGDPAVFTDGSTHNVHQILSASLGVGTPGSGNGDYDNFIGNRWIDHIIQSGEVAATGGTITMTNNMVFRYKKVNGMLHFHLHLYDFTVASGTVTAIDFDFSAIYSIIPLPFVTFIHSFHSNIGAAVQGGNVNSAVIHWSASPGFSGSHNTLTISGTIPIE